MVLPTAPQDREYQNFVEVDGTPHRRVTGANFSGSFTPAGLTVGGKHTEVTINDTSWTKLPPTPQAGRNAIGIQNYTGFEIRLNYDTYNPLPAGYEGMRVPNSNEKYYGITDSINIYAKADAGSGNVIVDVEELV